MDNEDKPMRTALELGAGLGGLTDEFYSALNEFESFPDTFKQLWLLDSNENKL